MVNTPAEKFVTAPGGVDLRTGRFVYEEGDLSIGGEGNAGMSFSRTLTATVPGHSNPFGNLSHNWDIMVSERKLSVDTPESSTGPDFQINVHFGGRSNGGARSQEGTSGNAINGISPRNEKGPACRAAAIKEFGSC